jgi:hypothetical protein
MKKAYTQYGIIGIFGAALGIIADLNLAYYPEGIHGFESFFTVSIDKVYPVLAQANHNSLMLSNYLAIVGIPLIGLGIYYIYKSITDEENRKLTLPMLWISCIAILAGTVFHASLSYIATLFRVKDQFGQEDQAAIKRIIDQFSEFSQPLAYSFQIAILIVTALFILAIWKNKSELPKWLLLINPLTIELSLGGLSMIAPLHIKTFLIATIYNFSFLIFILMFLIYNNTNRHSV